MIIEQERSSLALFLAGKAKLTGMIEAEPDKDFSAAMKVINEQIRQVAQGNPITGEEIAKSDEAKPSTD